MLLVPHTMAAIAIATVVKQPELALPLAFLSHFVLDFIPHWDPSALVAILEAKPGTGRYSAKVPVKVGRDVLLFILTDFLLALFLGLLFVWRALPDTVLAATIFFACFLANLADGFSLPLLFGKRWRWVLFFRRFHRGTHIKRLSLFWGLLAQAAVIAIGLLIALR